MNYTVSVIEHQGRLGGHTETYIDPGTGTPIDYGVVVWHDLDIVRKYFSRFGIPLTKAGFSGQETLYVDFATGKRSDYSSPDPTAALAAYEKQLEKYPYLEEGFDIPYPVPEDLLLPFKDFVDKYGLENMVTTVFQFGQGLGDILHLPTIYVMKNFGLDILRNIRTGFLTTAHDNNSEIYSLARAELGPDVHLNSTVLSTSRTSTSTRLLIRTPSGPKVILAKQLLLTIPPTPTNLRPFALDARERALFSQFKHSYYLTGLLTGVGLPPNTTLSNVDTARPFALPALPAAYYFAPTRVAGTFDVKFGAPIGAFADPSGAAPAAAVSASIVATAERLRVANGWGADGESPAFVAFSDHGPFEMVVGADAVAGGFYRRLGALQGYRGVWWTGAAWHTHDSSLLWRFTEGVVERLVERLG
ncbi:putative amine flavin-containing superfamily protein [Neofusicoccum parvum UCRNP2]|uniref:Putative amine flavin-containing superfamily protein n=1 Tax=Botryosphaeria parva (strain UCR-NP2) TaxID=1287680 RepID=R1EDT8_BOTPV|nr:putative amine flavin-containing superfamily protein [Neofusicoccum parvum UCRNP2]